MPRVSNCVSIAIWRFFASCPSPWPGPACWQFPLRGVILPLISARLGFEALRYPASKSVALLGGPKFLGDRWHGRHPRWQRCGRVARACTTCSGVVCASTDVKGGNNSDCCGILIRCLHAGQGSTFPRASFGAFNVLLQWGQLILKDIRPNPGRVQTGLAPLLVSIGRFVFLSLRMEGIVAILISGAQRCNRPQAEEAEDFRSGRLPQLPAVRYPYRFVVARMGTEWNAAANSQDE